MICTLCGSREYDGAFDEQDDFICVDCWATGEAVGHTAKRASPAPFALPVEYPAETLNQFVNACNKVKAGDGEMTLLCDTCKYREEECKPEDMQLDHLDRVTECFGYEEDEPCSA